ncbi:MAG: SH3 domain-containing protein, partial [Nitrososphaerales archaeon]
ASFAGRGQRQATDADKAAMLQFGAALLQQWAEATPVRWVSTLAEVNMRKGPSEQFDVIEKIAAGQQALVTGVSPDSKWWRVVCPDDTVGNCWVSGDPALTQPIAPAGSTGIQPGAEGQPAIDETQILAAVIRRVYTVDDTFGGTSKLPVVYLLSVDDVDETAIPYSSPARPLPAPVQQGIVAALSDLPAQFKWVASAGEVKRDRNNVVEGNAAIITVGKVQPQPDGSVRVSSSIYLGPMAAGGQTYVLQNQGGEWKVTSTTGSQWIS